MIWLKSHLRWAMLNLFAVSVMLLVLTRGSTDWNSSGALDPMLEAGKWAIRFLLICLSMTPLQKYFGWRSATKLRKPAGLWAFGFAVLHVLAYIRETQFSWLEFPLRPFIVLGILGFLILSALAITSNRWAIRRLRKNWKRLHRLVYLAGNLVILHAILATTMSKKIAVRDPQAIKELQVYLAVLVVLLAVRIPQVRRMLVQIPVLRRQGARADLPIIQPIKMPDRLPPRWPQIYMRATAASLGEVPPDEFIVEIQPEKDIEGDGEILTLTGVSE